MGEVIVMEVIVIVAVPIVAMPSTMATIPGNVTTAAMRSAARKAGAAHVATSKAGAAHVATRKAGAAHVASTKVSAAHVAATEVASAEMSSTAVAGVRNDRGKKQATRKGSYCGYTHSHDYSPYARFARNPSADAVGPCQEGTEIIAHHGNQGMNPRLRCRFQAIVHGNQLQPPRAGSLATE